VPRFSEAFSLGLSQHQLDFVDVSNEYDTQVYVDPYAIEIQDDEWSERASNYIRTFFKDVLDSLRAGDRQRANFLMSHLTEPKETFLGVSWGAPRGRGVGHGQASQLITAILNSTAFKTGLLTDLSEMALYVEGIDRDKISDLTTNIIRELLVEYTSQQCELHGIPTTSYASPPMWLPSKATWLGRYVKVPYIDDDPVILVPKYLVRRKLSLDSQEFYNKQITDFLVEEEKRKFGPLARVVKGKQKVLKTEIREANPKSKPMIVDMVIAHPELLKMFKEIASNQKAIIQFNDNDPTLTAICGHLADQFARIPAGTADADAYHKLVMGSLTALFYPDLIQPHKEWEINDGRKRIDIVFTNAADTGFFAQRRDEASINANSVIVECKNYSNDLANAEFDQLIGRFDLRRGKFGFITHRNADRPEVLQQRCLDAAKSQQGYIIALSDADLVSMLRAKAQLDDRAVANLLYLKFRALLA
jgi:hypothetical protein